MLRAAADRRPQERGGSVPGGSVVRGALAHFAVLSVVGVVVVSLASLLLAERIATSIALDDARTHAAAVATRLAAPLVDEQVRAGASEASEQLARVMTNRMRDGSIEHVKLWDESGRVIWSDQGELVGREFDLSPEVEELFGTRGTAAELSDLSREENIEEAGEGELLEVYVGAFDRDGEPLVFEAYLETEAMEENAQTLVTSFMGLIVGSLALYLLIVLPLARSLSRRVERAQTERARMTRHALLASELERRRIAEDLHHGVVQELAGLGYTLPAVRRHLEPDGDPGKARPLLVRATEIVQRNLVALRSLMTDIYPPDLHGAGLRYAVHQLVQTEAQQAGLQAHVDVDEDLDLPAEVGALAYRIVREGVRNVVKHAAAHQLVVELRLEGSDVLVRVADDGRGPGDEPVRSPDGHLGLRLLTDTVRDVGGDVEVHAREEGGTSLVARFPATVPTP